MIFKRGSKDASVKADVYINYGNGIIKNSDVSISPGTSILEVIKMVSEVNYTPDESATGHSGSMVTAIDGFTNDIFHFWMYYIREEDDPGWRLPMHTLDAVFISKSSRIAWRYHEAPKKNISGPAAIAFGPLFTKDCISRIKRCNRQF